MCLTKISRAKLIINKIIFIVSGRFDRAAIIRGRYNDESGK